jgi:hypothetical protein
MVVAAVILLGLRIPRVPMPAPGQGGRPLMEIARQPVFVIAVICAISSYALMNLVMTAAPLAMVHHGHSEEQAVLGIQWHVLAMFAPSFVTGYLIVRYGAETIIAAGLVLMIAARDGREEGHFARAAQWRIEGHMGLVQRGAQRAPLGEVRLPRPRRAHSGSRSGH